MKILEEELKFFKNLLMLPEGTELLMKTPYEQ